jgi:hypothetical protein
LNLHHNHEYWDVRVQVVQLQILVVLCDLITMQDSPSAGPNIAVDHEQSLDCLLQQVAPDAPLAGVARSLAAMLSSKVRDEGELESILLDLIMHDNVNAKIAASFIKHFISQGHVEAACKGLLHALERFTDSPGTLLQCLLEVKVRLVCSKSSQHAG